MNDRKNTLDRQTSRLYIDIIKGIAIFLMIWGHCVQYCSNGDFDFFENFVFKFIYSFHMPLFMLVSGYLFYFSTKKRSLSKLMSHRVQALIQPIIVCTIFIYFFSDAIVSKSLGAIISAPWLSNFGSLWFLWSVLATNIVFGVAEKITSNCFLKIILYIVGFFFVCLFPNWKLNVYMYPYFVIGFLFAKHKNNISKVILNFKYIFLIVFPIMLVFFEKKHYIYTTGIISSENIFELLYIDGYRWAIGLSGSIFVLVIIELIFKLSYSKLQYLISPISSLGKKSLQIYCMSVLVVSFWLPRIYEKVCAFLGTNILAENIILYNCLFTPLLSVIFSIIVYYFVVLLEKIRISKLLFGR